MLNPASNASSDQLLSTPIGMYVLADVCVLVYMPAQQLLVRLAQKLYPEIQGAAQHLGAVLNPVILHASLGSAILFSRSSYCLWVRNSKSRQIPIPKFLSTCL